MKNSLMENFIFLCTVFSFINNNLFSGPVNYSMNASISRQGNIVLSQKYEVSLNVGVSKLYQFQPNVPFLMPRKTSETLGFLSFSWGLEMQKQSFGRCSVKKLYLNISLNLLKNTCIRVSFLNKVARCFSVNFAKFFTKTYFYKTPPVATSGNEILV